MFQVRIHGRGGQGVVSGAEMLSVAAFNEGRYAQAFPSFGSERMGAPVMAFCRMDDKEIRLREPVMRPDALIIQDPTLLHQVDLFSGLAEDGYVILNSTKSFTELGLADFAAHRPGMKFVAIPATDIALAHVGRPVPNAALIAACAAVTGQLKLASVVAAIRAKFSGKVGDANAAAAADAWSRVESRKEAVHA